MAFKRTEKKELSAGLQLTSLIDCFSILIIYLLVVTTLGQNTIDIPKGITLPKATQGSEVNPTLVVEVRGNQYTINGKTLSMDRLVGEFKRQISKIEDKSNISLVIQADQKAQYSDINPLVMAGMTAGFNQVGFSVLRENGQ